MMRRQASCYGSSQFQYQGGAFYGLHRFGGRGGLAVGPERNRHIESREDLPGSGFLVGDADASHTFWNVVKCRPTIDVGRHGFALRNQSVLYKDDPNVRAT